LIRRLNAAAIAGDGEVVVWGTGQPRREFLYSDDMADACVHLLNLDDKSFEDLLALAAGMDGFPLVNIGYGDDLTIADLAKAVAAAVGYTGSIRFDQSYPDGTLRKLLDTGRLKATGWKPETALQVGLAAAVTDFRRLPQTAGH
jgi:GDP-L-fucose synthase